MSNKQCARVLCIPNSMDTDLFSVDIRLRDSVDILRRFFSQLKPFIEINKDEKLRTKIMDKNWNQQIESWKEVRSNADQVIIDTLRMHFPAKYGYPNPMVTPKSNPAAEAAIGRTLWAYARSDLTIKTIQLNRAGSEIKWFLVICNWKGGEFECAKLWKPAKNCNKWGGLWLKYLSTSVFISDLLFFIITKVRRIIRITFIFDKFNGHPIAPVAFSRTPVRVSSGRTRIEMKLMHMETIGFRR